MFSSRFLSYFKSKAIIIIRQYQQKKYYSPSTSAILKIKFLRNEERISLLISGTLTVEAAIVLPIFIFVMICIISLGQVIHIQTRLQNALETTAEKIASYSYAEKLIKEEIEGLNQVIAEWIIDGITFVSVKNEIVQLAGKDYLDHSCIKNGSEGIFLIGSTISSEEEFVDLVLSYSISPFSPILNTNQLWITQRCRRRLWIGTEEVSEEAETIVYVTVNGTVYHTNLECSYLKRNIETVYYADLKSKRNESGGKYYLCEFCSKGSIGEFVYITKYGDRYHYRATCPGLTRGIRSILLSQADGLPQCSKCKQE